MPAQVRDQSHPSAGDGHGTPANASNAKVSEKSPLTRELYRIPSHAGQCFYLRPEEGLHQGLS